MIILFELVVDCMSGKGLSTGKLLMFSHYIILNLNTYVTVKNSRLLNKNIKLQ